MYNRRPFLQEVTWQNENVAELDACAAILVFNLIQAQGEYDQESVFVTPQHRSTAGGAW